MRHKKFYEIQTYDKNFVAKVKEKQMAKKQCILVLALAVLVAGGIVAQDAENANEGNAGTTKNIGLSLGAKVLLGFPTYEGGSDFFDGASPDWEEDPAFGIAGFVAYKFTDLIGVQVEVIFNNNNVTAKVADTVSTNVVADFLQIPLLVNVGTTLGASGISLGGVGGIYFTVPLGDLTLTMNTYDANHSMDVEWTGSAGIMIGAYAGKKLGPGTLFADVRYSGDFEDSEIEESGQTMKVFKKSGVGIGIGYSFQF
jgi:hypothetical protein